MKEMTLLTEVDNLLKNNNLSSRHTFFQLKHFVIGKEITTQAKMQKCLKEMESRVAALKSMKLSQEEAKDDIELINLKIINLNKKKSKNDINKQYKEIQIRKLKRKSQQFQDALSDLIDKQKETEEEIDFFLSAFKQLEQIEPYKGHDDPESNAKFWNDSFGQELQLRLLLQKPLDLELVKSILALSNDSPVRKEMVGILQQVQQKAIQQKQQQDALIQQAAEKQNTNALEQQNTNE
jgi:hypothetical protein